MGIGRAAGPPTSGMPAAAALVALG